MERHGEAERMSRFQVDHELEFSRLQNRKIGRRARHAAGGGGGGGFGGLVGGGFGGLGGSMRNLT
jgi:hypothetical protein